MRELKLLTGKLVELNGVVDGAGGEAGGVGAHGERGDAVAVVAEELRRTRGEKSVVDGD